MRQNYSVTVTTSPQRVVNLNRNRTSLLLFNNTASVKIYFGSDSTLTPDNGMVIMPQTGFGFNLGLGDDPQVEYWVVSDSEADLRVTEAYATKATGEVA